MPLLAIVRLIATLISLVILGAAVYFLWGWFDPPVLRSENGEVRVLRDDWRLWVGLFLLAYSFAGKFVWKPLLAGPDRGEPTMPVRGNGQRFEGAGGAALHVEVLGNLSGPTLILTHGSALDSTIWFYAKRDLGTRFRLIVWDMPGYGKSALGSGGRLDLDLLADNLAAVIAFADTPVVLVGHSMGGMTIQTLARKAPHLFGTAVVGTVLVNTTYTNPLKTMILSGLAQALRPLIELAFRLQIWLQPLSWLSAWHSYLNGSAHRKSHRVRTERHAESARSHVAPRCSQSARCGREG